MATFSFIVGTVGWFPIDIFDDSTGLPVEGILHSDISAFAIGKPGVAGTTAKTVGAGDWVEHGDGRYQVKLTGADTSDEGHCTLAVTYNGETISYDFTVVPDIVTEIENGIGGTINTKTDTILARIGNPAVTLADDIAGISGGGGGGPTAAEVADAVWDEARAGHVAAGSFGEQLDAAVSSRASQASVDTGLARLRALVGDNVVIDSIVDPGTGATAIRERGYDSAANADAAYASSPAGGATGLVYTMTFAATYSGSDLTKSKRTTA